MDVLMPDGTLVTDVPEGITQSQLLARYSKFTAAKPAKEAPVNTAFSPQEQAAAAATAPASGIASILATPSKPRVSAPYQPTLSPEEQMMGAIGAPSEGIGNLIPRPQGQVNAEGQITGMTRDQYAEALRKREEQTPIRSAKDVAVDAGVTFLKSAIGLPEAYVGLADIPTMGYAGKLLKQAGYNPKESKEILDTYLSEAQQVANRKVSEAEGFLPTIGAALQNPSVIATSIAESIPQMLGGASIAKGILKAAPKATPLLAAAAGEGVLGAGSAAEQIRQQSKDELLTGKQALSAIGSGVGTAAFGVAGGRLAHKFGLADIDTLLVSASTQPGSKSVKDFAKKVIGSGVSEGLFEELPQSAQEQVWMNYATDKPIFEGVPEAMAMGALTGAVMGAGATTLAGRAKTPQEERNQVIADLINASVEGTTFDKDALLQVAANRMSPDSGFEGGTNIRMNPIEVPGPTAPPPAPSGIATLAPAVTTPPADLAGLTAAPSESMDTEAMLREILGGQPTVPAVTVNQPEAAEEPKIVDTYDMGENTEFLIVKTQSGYIANLYDKDAEQFVPGANRIFKTDVFGDDALPKAIEFAKAEQAKIVQPEGKPSGIKTPEAQQTETQEQQAPAASVTLYRGVPQGQEQRPTVGGAKFMSPDRKVAEMYAGPDGSVSEEVYSFKNPLQAPTWADAKSNLGLPQSATMEDLIDVARKAGHDGVTFNTTNGPEYIVIGKKAPAGNAAPAAPVATPVEAKAKTEEDYRRDVRNGQRSINAVRDGQITQEQYEQYQALEKVARQELDKLQSKQAATLSPAQQEAIQIAEQMEALGEKNFSVGVRSAARNPTVESNLPFYRERLQELKAQQGKIEAKQEGFNWQGFLDAGEQKYYSTFQETAPQQAKDVFENITNAIFDVTNAANNLGYKINDIKKNASLDARKLGLQYTNLLSDGLKLLSGNYAIQNNYKRANPEKFNLLIKKSKDTVANTQEAIRKSVPKPEDVAEAQQRAEEGEKAINKIKNNPKLSLWNALKGTLGTSEMVELFPGKIPVYARVLQSKTGRGDMSDIVANGNLDDYLEPAKRHDSPVFDVQESTEYIKDQVRSQNYLSYDTQIEIETIFGSVEEAERIVNEYLTEQEQNYELEEAANEQRESEGVAFSPESEGEISTPEPDEGEALTLTTPEGLRAEEERRQKIEEDQAKADKEAEAKAKADQEVGEFTLTGSNRPADVAAARGQKDIFAQEEEKPVTEEGVKVVPFEAESNVVGDLLNETREEENPFDTRFNALMHSKEKPAKPKPTTFMTIEKAKAQLAEWKAEAKRQGKTSINSGRTIISLFDASGEWSKPWSEAGYNVWTFDIQDGQDINDFSAEYLLNEGFGDLDIWGILAAPPCTDFSSSGAQFWAKKDANGQTELSNELVRQTLRTVEFLQPKIWAMENPIGRIAKLNNLPPAQLSFDPNFYGDPYTKRTLLWGNFENNLPMAPVEATEGSRIIKLSGKDKYTRSLTPEGFAYAFFMANNAESMTPAERLTRTYFGVDPTAFEGATKEDEKAVKESNDPAFEDNYYDGELEAAADIARNIIRGEEAPEEEAAPKEVAKEEEAPKTTAVQPVKTPEGGTMRYPMASVLFNDGYKVLALNDPRTYVDKAGKAHRTFEKEGVRVSLTPQLVLFQNKNAVLTGQGESTDLVINALLVDQNKRGQGLANDALKNLTDAANQYEVTLYIEPVPLVNLKEKNVGLDRQQLEDLYKKFGFDFAENSNKVMVREPEVQKAGNEEVLGPVEKPAAPRLKNEPYTIEANFTEVGEEKQHLLLSDQSSKLTESQNQTLEKQYGAKRDTAEFLDGLRKDVIAFITQGAKAVNGKIRAIIKQVANGVLAVAIVFNPQFVSKPYTIAVPQYDIKTSEVIKDLPKEAKTMSDAAKRAYGVIYPALEKQLKEKDKLFIVADKQSGNTYLFNPDGSLLLQSKTLFGKAIGDYMHGDNEIVANRITPAGVFDLGLRDAKRSAGEAYTAGDYDFGKVFVLDKSHMGSNGPYSNTIMHSVWTHETDAKQRLAALEKPGAEDSRYSFGCINVNKETFKYLITNHLNQMDGAKIFIVPENGTNVMDFINGKAMNSDDIIRQKIEPVTKTTVTEKQVPAPKPGVERKIVGREEEAKVGVRTEGEQKKPKKRENKTFYSIEPTVVKPKLIVDVPNENWLQGKVDYAIEKGRNKNGVPHMSTVTGRFNRPVEVSLRVLSELKGENNEQNNVRQDSLDYIRKNWDEVSKEPPYIEVAYNGEAYVSEGNHRIMVALEKGLETMPVEIRYFDGGERRNGPLNPNRISSLDEAYNSVGRTRDIEEEAQRSPSLKRDLKTLNRMRKDGRITDEQFVERADAAILADEQQRLKEEPSERKRGFLHIQTRLNQAVDAGDISREARDLATWFMVNNEDLVSDLGVSIIGKGKAGQGGQYSSFNRIMTVIKNGGSDLVTVHEILHHLERMMPPKIQQAIRRAWSSQLAKAAKAAKTPNEKLYFAALMDAHYGDGNMASIEVPKGAEKNYKLIKSLLEALQKRASSEDFAKEMLKLGMVPISNYEYFNPSEFWAVNGSDIVKARFDSVKGGTLARLKNWLKELGQKIKSIFSLKSDASIIRALDSLAKSDGKFVTKEMLGEGDYQAVIRNYKGNPAPVALWDSPDPSFMDGITYQIADKQIDTKRVIEQIQKTVGQIDERLDAYTKETLYSSRSAARIEDFLKDQFSPLFEKMKAMGVTKEALEEYLHNRHAEERNEQINKINLSPTVQDIGSGISTADARNYLANLPAAEKAKLQSLAAMVDKIIEGTQDLLVSGGLETQETINTWNKTYKHYIPLQRDDLDFVHTGSGYAGGVGTKGSASKRAVGSIKPVKDILANVAIQREKAIRRSEQAHVGRALYALAITSPNPGFWLPVNPNAIKNKAKLVQEMVSLGLSIQDAENLIQEPKVPVIDKLTGLVKYQVNPSMRSSENVFPVRVDGEDRFIIFNPKEERAMRMVRSLKNMDADELGWFLGNIGAVTRWIASINTQYNPFFGPFNMARDVGSALLNLSTTEIAGKQIEVLSGSTPALFAIWNQLRGNPAKDAEQQKWMDLFEQMRLAGGTTGFAKQFSGQTENWANFMERMKTGKPREKVNVVEQQLKKLNRGNSGKAAQAVFDWLSDYNDAMENAVRLSAFKVALQNHSEQKAASIAKELTVNFNRKGASSPTLQALYAFINASTQASVRLGKTLRGPLGRKIIAGGITLGVIQAIALALNGYDDGDPPDFLKDKNFIIPIPFAGENYAILPMPLGYNVFPGIGRILTETVLIQTGFLKSNKDIGDKVLGIGSLMLDAFNPLGAGSITQMLAPTALDPIFAVAQNKSAFGRPIYKEDRDSQPTPGFQRSRDTATAISQALAEFLNYVSSPAGTEFTKGRISPTADEIDYLAGQYFGGVAREVIKGAEAIKAQFTEEDIPTYRIPVVGKLYGETQSPAAVSSKFYDNVSKMAKYENEIKRRQENKLPIDEFLENNPEAILWKRANRVENEVSKLNKTRKEYLKDNDMENVKRIDEIKNEKMKLFNDAVKEAQ